MSDHIIEEIRKRADILEIIGEHVALRRSGKSYRGPCPLHKGDGPNFAIDPDRGLFKCFVCGEGGDIFTFLMKHLGFDFLEAARHLGARVGVEVPERRSERDDPYKPLRGVLGFASEWFQKRLQEPTGGSALAYLQELEMSLEDALKFGVGYADDSWDALRSAALDHGFEESLLLQAGVLARSEKTKRVYDRFRGRLMFTIQDLRDRPVGFGGRDLGSESDVPKYINSPESPVFKKGEELYGLNWARHSIRRGERVAIAEGYTDVITMHRAGLDFAVAGLGTSFTIEQARRLGRYTTRAYLLYDSDTAGLRATFRTGDTLLAAGVHPMVVTLPPGQDPDSLLRADGSEALLRLMDDAVDILERKLQILQREGYLDRIEGRRRAVDGLLSTLRAVSDPALRDIYIDRASESTNTRRDTLVHEIARGGAAPSPRRRSGMAAAGSGADTRAPGGGEEARRESTFLTLLLRDMSLVRRALRLGLAPRHISDPALREVFEALAQSADSGLDSHDWSEAASAARERAEELLESEEKIPDPDRAFDAVSTEFLTRELRGRLVEIDREMELAESDQQKRLFLEKVDIAEELRGLGQAAVLIPGLGARRPAATEGPEPVSSGHPR